MYIFLFILFYHSLSAQNSFVKTIGGSGDDFGRGILHLNDNNLLLIGSTSSVGNGALDASLIKVDYEGNEIWAKTYGGSSDDEFMSGIELSDGNLILVGRTKSFTSFDYDFLIIKTDNLGNEIWSRTFGSAQDELARGVLLNSEGNLIISGQSGGTGNLDFFVYCLDINGQMIWSRKYGDYSNDYPRERLIEIPNGYLMPGTVNGLGNGQHDATITILDDLGNEISTSLAGGNSNDNYTNAFLSNDNTYLVGSTSSYTGGNKSINIRKIDNSSTTQDWNYVYEYNNLEMGTYHSYKVDDGIIVSSFNALGNNIIKVIFFKVDLEGNVLWSFIKESTGTEFIQGMVENIEGDIFAIGRSNSYSINGDYDYLFIKLNPNTLGDCDFSPISISRMPITANFTNIDLNESPLPIGIDQTLISVSQSFNQEDICVEELPNVDFTMSDEIICEGECISLTDNSTANILTWNWTIPGGSITTSTDQNVNNVCFENSGIYNITLEACNSLGCDQLTKVITVIDSPSITNSNSNPETCGEENGSATITVNGGVIPYIYNWENESNVGVTISNQSTAINLSAGFYSVTVSNADGSCSTILNGIQVGAMSPPPLITNSDNSAALCGEINGTATITVNGGIAPYLYDWENESNTGVTISNQPTAINLAEGTYSVTVSNADGSCPSVLGGIQVGSIEAPSITNSNSNPETCGDMNGTASIEVTGGLAPYVFQWENESNVGISVGTQITATNLISGTYSVTVSNADGSCPTILNGIPVGNIDEPTIVMVNSVPATCDLMNGALDVEVSGGISPYNFNWENESNVGVSISTINSLTNLASGTYALTVSNADGSCSSILSGIVVSQTDGPTIDGQTIVPENCGSMNGTLSINVSNGTMPYQYNWEAQNNPGISISTTDSANNLSFGYYNVSVSNADGTCLTIATMLVDLIGEPSLNISATNENCGDANGSATVQISGGNPPYNITWENNINPGIIIGDSTFVDSLSVGTYSVSVSNSDGTCLSSSSIVVEDVSNINMEVLIRDIDCYGNADGILHIYGYDGELPYSYSIDGGVNFSSDSLYPNLNAGVYSVVVQDALGCSKQQDAIINEPNELIVDAGIDQEINYGETIQLQGAISYSENVIINWTTNAIDTLSCTDCLSPFITPLDHYTFTITAKDTITGCTSIDEVKIFVLFEKNVFIPNAFSPNEDGYNDNFIVYSNNNAAEILNMKIFNRWGGLVFEQNNFQPNDITQGWDGTFRGKKLNPNVFAYLITVQFIDGREELFKGNISLLR